MARVIIIKVDKMDYENLNEPTTVTGVSYRNIRGNTHMARPTSFIRPSKLHYVTSEPGVGPIYRSTRIDHLTDVEFAEKVRSSPQIFTRLGDQWVMDMENVLLKCELRGNPTPKVTWLKNQKPLPINRKYFTTYDNGVAQLSIFSVDNTDAGWFTCRAENPYGTRETNGMLYVSQVYGNRLKSLGKKALTDSRHFRLLYPSMGKIKPF